MRSDRRSAGMNEYADRRDPCKLRPAPARCPRPGPAAGATATISTRCSPRESRSGCTRLRGRRAGWGQEPESAAPHSHPLQIASCASHPTQPALFTVGVPGRHHDCVVPGAVHRHARGCHGWVCQHVFPAARRHVGVAAADRAIRQQLHVLRGARQRTASLRETLGHGAGWAAGHARQGPGLLPPAPAPPPHRDRRAAPGHLPLPAQRVHPVLPVWQVEVLGGGVAPDHERQARAVGGAVGGQRLTRGRRYRGSGGRCEACRCTPAGAKAAEPRFGLLPRCWRAKRSPRRLAQTCYPEGGTSGRN